MTGWRAVFDTARRVLSTGAYAAKVADARRAARCEEANEPTMSRIAQAPAAIDSLTIPAFVPSAAALAADARAPSWNPDIASSTPRQAAANGLLAALKDVVGKVSHGEERPRHRMLTTRDPSFAPGAQAAANAPHDDFIAPDRKLASR